MLGFHFLKKERKGLNYNTLCKSFPLCYFSLIKLKTFVVVEFERVCCRRGPPPCSHSGCVDLPKGAVLCVKLLSGGLLIGCTGGFPLTQVVAALVLLPHAVDQEEDEEDGEQEADHTTCDNSWEAETQWGDIRLVLFCLHQVNFHNDFCCCRDKHQCNFTANDQKWGLTATTMWKPVLLGKTVSRDPQQSRFFSTLLMYSTS